MKFANILKQIAEQELAVKQSGTPVQDPSASGAAPGDKAGSRTLDDGQKLDNHEGTKVSDGSAAGSAPGDKAGARPADSSDSLAVKPSGTTVNDPVSHVTQGQGTEVQGNKIHEAEDEIFAIFEELYKEAEGSTYQDRQAAFRKKFPGLAKSLDKSTAKHNEYDKKFKKADKEDDEMKEACAAGKKRMAEEIEKSLNEGTSFDVSLSEDLSGLLAKAELTEEFAATAIELIEATVSSITRDHLSKVNAYAAEVVSEAYDAAVTQLEESVEQYLAEEVAEWKEENKLAIETGFKLRVAESFMDGLKDLLEAHYVEVPEDKEDLYETAIAKGEEVLESLTVEQEKTLKLESEVAELKKKLFVESYIAESELTAVQADKLRSISEGVTSETEDELKSKLDSLVESVVSKKSTPSSELVVEDLTPVQEEESQQPLVESDIERLASQLSKTMRKY